MIGTVTDMLHPYPMKTQNIKFIRFPKERSSQSIQLQINSHDL